MRILRKVDYARCAVRKTRQRLAGHARDTRWHLPGSIRLLRLDEIARATMTQIEQRPVLKPIRAVHRRDALAGRAMCDVRPIERTRKRLRHKRPELCVRVDQATRDRFNDRDRDTGLAKMKPGQRRVV